MISENRRHENAYLFLVWLRKATGSKDSVDFSLQQRLDATCTLKLSLPSLPFISVSLILKLFLVIFCDMYIKVAAPRFCYFEDAHIGRLICKWGASKINFTIARLLMVITYA